MHSSNAIKKVDQNGNQAYVDIMRIPVELRAAVDQIIDITARKENLYGSKRYSWLTFGLPDHGIIMDRFSQLRVNNKIVYEITHPDFYIQYTQQWPSDKKQWTWNDLPVEPNTYQQSYGVPNAGGYITAIYTGDLDAIASVAMHLWMVSASGV